MQLSRYLMALDAGTGSIRAVIFDLEGNQIATSQKNGHIFPTQISQAQWALIYKITGTLLAYVFKKF